MKPITPLVASLVLLLAQPALAQDTTPKETPTSVWDEIEDALGGGKLWLKLRYRFEFVDQDAVPDHAYASTLRTVLGYETATYKGASALIEFEDVSVIGNKLFDDMPGGNRSVVLDDDNSEINQVYGQYAHEEYGQARVGRQRIILDNARFVGNVGWRQNEQTFDAASGSFDIGPVESFYAYLGNVNRIVGEDSPRGDDDMNSHLVHAQHEFEDLGKASAYGYFLDYDDVDALSSNTFGVRFAGKRMLEEDLDLVYAAEYAHQSDADDNPASYDESYYLAELGARVDSITAKAGFEVLGGSGDPGEAFQTPLATAHAFNGWADQFVVTPDNGLEDFYLSVQAKLGKAKGQAVFHYFAEESGGDKYGTEYDAILSYPVRENLTAGLKAAVFDDAGFSTDTVKAWIWLAYSI